MTARKQASNVDMNGLKISNLGVPTALSTDAARQVDLEAVEAFSISRTNHTGSQLAATISDFNTQVRTNRLDQLTAPTAPVGLNSQKLTSVLDPSAAQDAATKNYVDTQFAALTSGQTLKGTVRAVATTNVDITTAPATIDGRTAAAGDVFLLAGQTTGTQNGPYTWAGTSTPMTRVTNWDTTTEAVVGSYWIAREGSQADKFVLLTNDTFTLGSTVAAFTYIAMVTLPTAVEQDCGNGSATSFAITHSLGTRAVNVVIWRNASPYDEVDCYIEHTDVNTVTLKPDSVWASNEFHAAVSKL